MPAALHAVDHGADDVPGHAADLVSHRVELDADTFARGDEMAPGVARVLVTGQRAKPCRQHAPGRPGNRLHRLQSAGQVHLGDDAGIRTRHRPGGLGLAQGRVNIALDGQRDRVARAGPAAGPALCLAANLPPARRRPWPGSRGGPGRVCQDEKGPSFSSWQISFLRSYFSANSFWRKMILDARQEEVKP